jgi:hypothetical protein
MLSLTFLLASSAWPQIQHLGPDFVTVSQSQGNHESRLRLSDTSELRLIDFTNPTLGVLKDGVGLFQEDSCELLKLGGEDSAMKLRLLGFSSGGLVYMPNYEGYQYYALDEQAAARAEKRLPQAVSRQDIERSLALASYRLKADYSIDLPLESGSSLRLGFENDAFTRLAYSFYDLQPMFDYLGEGKSLSAAFADYYTGLSFSGLRESAKASLGLRRGDGSSIAAFGKLSDTDFLYADYSLGLDFALGDRAAIEAAYDFASYKAFNGKASDQVRLQVSTKAGSGARLEAQARYGISELQGSDLSFGLSLELALPSGQARGSLAQRSRAQEAAGIKALSAEKESSPDFEWMHLSRIRVESVDEDIHALLGLRDRSLHDTVSILYTYRDKLRSYDYSRVLDLFALDRLSGESPAAFIDRGGICVDAARFVATVLGNNGSESRVVLVQGLAGSPHSFAVSRDGSGSYYAIDGVYFARRMEGADSFASAAALYSGGFTQMILRDAEGRVESVFVSSDAMMLDSLSMD